MRPIECCGLSTDEGHGVGAVERAGDWSVDHRSVDRPSVDHRSVGILVAAMMLLTVLTGCSTVGYYAQAVGGHFEVMSSTRPIDDWLNDVTTPRALAQQLSQVQSIRAFASTGLGLPDNDSYTAFGDLGRRYVVWNVVATPELSLDPVRSCFAVVGCLAYRGFFDDAAARAFALEQRERGHDVLLGGVRAYSTLGWFADPVLNTMLNPKPEVLAELIFHELAHQELYVADDSAFNEAFATAVGRAGADRWATTQLAFEEIRQRMALARRHEQVFLSLTGEARSDLRALYQSARTSDTKRIMKHSRFTALRASYRLRSSDWPTPKAYSHFFDDQLNNARLAAVATYHELVPGFDALLSHANGNLVMFYQRARELSQRPREARHARLRALATGAANAPPD
jgi:predicted aminopeptidase